MSIRLSDISKTFGSFTALKNVSLHVPMGELVALLGPSGSGKTTLLRIISGLEEPDPGSGPILFAEENVAGRKVGDRRVGFVFQHYALFRHMTVFENIAFGLRVRPRKTRPSRAEIRARVGELLRLIQLESLGNRYPSQLSGGQRQRVALARALAVEPKVLLLDEPFGALDAKVRPELRRWLRRLHDEIHVPSVFVTHDQEEALEVADRVVIMNSGRIEQIGTPEEVFHKPASEFVMDFLGQVNVFYRRLPGGTEAESVEALEFQCPDELPAGLRPAKVFVRPHELDLDTQPSGKTLLRGQVQHINAAGAQVKVEVISEFGELLHVEIPQSRYRELSIAKGSNVYVIPRQVKIFMGQETRGPPGG